MAKRTLIAILFLGAYIGTYFSLYAWVVPISAGNRLILSQCGPFLFATSIGLGEISASSEHDQRSIWLFNLMLLPWLWANVFSILTQRAAITYGRFQGGL